MSPLTTLQRRGLTKRVQTAQLNMPRGAGWYCASSFDTGCSGGASARTVFEQTGVVGVGAAWTVAVLDGIVLSMRAVMQLSRRQWLVLMPLLPWGIRAASAQQEYIGTATMLPDGTIQLRLRAPLPGGGSGEGELDYKPDDPDYQKILAHLGGLKPGETKPVKPWPDAPSEKP